jgi:hypothetical protein
MADLAGSERCVALGHHPDSHGDWGTTPDDHPMSFDGEPLCSATRYGAACTECESEECGYPPVNRDAFWALFAQTAL